MRIFLYNILQFWIFLVSFPVLPFLAFRPRLRRRMPARLGLHLPAMLADHATGKPTFWVHALSVGEVTSAVPLVTALRHRYPESRIILTVSTETGQAVADELLSGVANHIIATPIDILPIVERYIHNIRPDIYILVETDFWPNLIAALSRAHIPMILVNGRISVKSFNSYRKHAWFFRPLFCRFTHICLQTEEEKEKFRKIGVDIDRLSTLGNLKFHQPTAPQVPPTLRQFFHVNRLHLVAGSTHRGEEEIIFDVYKELRQRFPQLYLVLAPRTPRRSEEILQLATNLGLNGLRRTTNRDAPADFLLIDTIGELAECYFLGEIGFTGGSLVAAGGHNPIEPARAGIPVLFGPHMEDFKEIAEELLQNEGARQVKDRNDLFDTLLLLLEEAQHRLKMGRCAEETVSRHRDGIDNHLRLLEGILNGHD